MITVPNPFLIVLLLSGCFVLGGCASSGGSQAGRIDGEYKRMLENQKQYAHATVAEETKVKMPEPTAQSCESLGDRYVIDGKNVKALMEYTKALELEPASINVRYKMGRVLLRQRLPVDALQQFEEVVRRDPSNPLGYYGKSLVYIGQNDLEKSEENLEKTVKIDSTLWQAHALLGLVCDLKKQHARAVEQYEKTLVLNPRSAAVYNNLGISLYSLRDYDRAVDAFRSALRLDPENTKAANNLGLALYSAGRHQQAFEAFKKGRNEAVAYHNMGYLYMMEHSYDKSLESFQKAIDTSPTFYVKASENLERVKAAKSGLRKGANGENSKMEKWEAEKNRWEMGDRPAG
jgi:tetratricopeptide (TPR) repeat protein